MADTLEKRRVIEINALKFIDGVEASRFANPLLPDTRSEMALPWRVGERVMVALDIQSAQAQTFGKNDVTSL